MLREDDLGAINDGRESMGEDDVSVVVKTPSPVRDGITDVVSMKGLLRAVQTLRQSGLRRTDDEFERALAKMINLNGAMARVILDGKRR